MVFPLFIEKETRGSNLNNKQVQCLLKTQEGQIEKIEQFQKFIKKACPSFLKKTGSSNLNSLSQYQEVQMAKIEQFDIYKKTQIFFVSKEIKLRSSN